MVRRRYVTVAEAADEVGLTESYIRRLCREGRVRGAERFGKSWMIPTPVTVYSVIESQTGGRAGLIGATEAAAVLGITRQRVIQLCRAGGIKGARKVGRHWAIPTPVERVRLRGG